MKRGGVPIDLLPSQVADLGSTQPMPIGHEDHGGVSMAVAIVFCGLDQLLNLSFGKVLPATKLPAWLKLLALVEGAQPASKRLW